MTPNSISGFNKVGHARHGEDQIADTAEAETLLAHETYIPHTA